MDSSFSLISHRTSPPNSLKNHFSLPAHVCSFSRMCTLCPYVPDCVPNRAHSYVCKINDTLFIVIYKTKNRLLPPKTPNDTSMPRRETSYCKLLLLLLPRQLFLQQILRLVVDPQTPPPPNFTTQTWRQLNIIVSASICSFLYRRRSCSYTKKKITPAPFHTLYKKKNVLHHTDTCEKRNGWKPLKKPSKTAAISMMTLI